MQQFSSPEILLVLEHITDICIVYSYNLPSRSAGESSVATQCTDAENYSVSVSAEDCKTTQVLRYFSNSQTHRPTLNVELVTSNGQRYIGSLQ